MNLVIRLSSFCFRHRDFVTRFLKLSKLEKLISNSYEPEKCLSVTFSNTALPTSALGSPDGAPHSLFFWGAAPEGAPHSLFFCWTAPLGASHSLRNFKKSRNSKSRMALTLTFYFFLERSNLIASLPSGYYFMELVTERHPFRFNFSSLGRFRIQSYQSDHLIAFQKFGLNNWNYPSICRSLLKL